MSGLKLCQDIGFSPVKVNAVLLKDLNHAELDAFIQWAAEGVNLRFIELMETGENGDILKNIISLATSWLRNLWRMDGLKYHVMRSAVPLASGSILTVSVVLA